jgi:intracellular sulfur oxidation DsrE/DsrF family protein
MTENQYTDEKLNLFIDKQLDKPEMDEIHKAILDDNDLRERVCQLRAVRELISYAYNSVPETESHHENTSNFNILGFKALAASLLIALGVLTGWAVNETARPNKIASATEVFDYFKNSSTVERAERKIVLHVTTGDIAAVHDALNEAEHLLASYSKANRPMKLDIITNKEGINMLRADVSPYVNRIEQIIETNENVAFYACQRSILKAMQREGKEIVMMPKAVTSKTAQELISERLEKGWVYIKV